MKWISFLVCLSSYNQSHIVLSSHCKGIMHCLQSGLSSMLYAWVLGTKNHVTSENKCMCWEYSMSCGCPSTGREKHVYVKLKKDTHFLWTERKHIIFYYTLCLKSDKWTCTLLTWLVPWLTPCMWWHSAIEEMPVTQFAQFVSDKNFLCPCWRNNF